MPKERRNGERRRRLWEAPKSPILPPPGVPRPRLRTHWGRLLSFFAPSLLLAGLTLVLFVDLLWRIGWSRSGFLVVVPSALLFFLNAVGCMLGIFGFVARRTGEQQRITKRVDYQQQEITGTRTALAFPIHNEDSARVYEGLRTTYLSLRETGRLECFEFFILSDSTEPEKWVREEQGWSELVAELEGNGRIFYRRRLGNEDKKAGNIREFLQTWGERYKYFVVFDADSVMRGQMLVALVQLMEACPNAGMIQSASLVMNAESLFGRWQQFASHFYAPVFNAGLDFWAQNFGNFWGHNAIIRTQAFLEQCWLPALPGPAPFGGSVLSHDFVEAAMLVKGNWEVLFAYDLPGSHEETPPDLIQHAQRDRRWCQGNLQHGLLQWARGLRGASRLHLLFGTCCYVAGPLWLLSLLFLALVVWLKLHSGLSIIAVHSFTEVLSVSVSQQALLVFGLCMTMVLLPKFLALADLALDRPRRRAFGGLARVVASVLVETIISALTAPLFMLWYTLFVGTAVLGRTVSWGPRVSSPNGLSWSETARWLWPHTVIGLVWGVANWFLLPPAFWWFVPVLAGMVLSIPLAVWTSRPSWGRGARALGLLLTPEETEPPPELVSLRERLAQREAANAEKTGPAESALAQVIWQPRLNALQLLFLDQMRKQSGYAAAMAAFAKHGWDARVLGEKLLAAGPMALKAEEILCVLLDTATMVWLHQEAWRRQGQPLEGWTGRV
jgi:membrane glycosyltransferase